MIERLAYPDRNSSRHSRGFATIFAISLIILVGMALATLTTYFALEASRTRSQTDQAQLRQLLTAGAVAALQHADADDAKVSLDLPPDLVGASVSIEITGSGDTKTAEITAAFNQRTSSQTLTLHHDATGDKVKWSIVTAELDAAAQPLATQPTTQSSAGQSSVAQPPAATQPSDRSTAASQRS